MVLQNLDVRRSLALANPMIENQNELSAIRCELQREVPAERISDDGDGRQLIDCRQLVDDVPGVGSEAGVKQTGREVLGVATIALVETHDVHPVVSTALQLFVGAIALGFVSLAAEKNQPADWTLSSVLALLFLAIFGSAIAFALYYWLLRYMDAYKATTINLIVPFVAILEGSLILHEMVTAMMLLSAIIVLGAVGFVLKAQMDNPPGLQLSRAADEPAEP